MRPDKSPKKRNRLLKPSPDGEMEGKKFKISVIEAIVAVIGLIVAIITLLNQMSSNKQLQNDVHATPSLPALITNTGTPIPPTATLTPTVTPSPTPPPPHALKITVSYPISAADTVTKELAANAPIAQLDSVSVKAGALVTVVVQPLDENGAAIAPRRLNYAWELLYDKPEAFKPQSAQNVSTWSFIPPTDLPHLTLTVNVSDGQGHDIKIVIPLKIEA